MMLYRLTRLLRVELLLAAAARLDLLRHLLKVTWI